jgi:tetratricopeptide (TPR) repeat protein
MFEELHENLEGLRRVFTDEASPVEAERVAAHLTGCRECWLLATRAMAGHKTTGGIAIPGPLRPLVDLYEMEQTRLEEWLEAQAIWTEVRSLSPKAKRDKVRLTRSLHTLSFLEALLEEGGAAGAPAESEELFYLALLVAGQLPSPRFSVDLKNDLCAECCAEIANARRRSAKWGAARDALKKGAEYARNGSTNGVAEGKLLCVVGALEDDLGNSEEAVGILRQAAGLFEAAAQGFLRSRTFVQLAYILVDVNPAESLQVAEQALSLIPADYPRLVWFAETIRINGLIALGAPHEALLRFNALKVLYEQFREPVIQLRRRFTAARILEHLGRTQRAESLFQEVIASDLEHGLVKDFFLDLVYLLGFYLRRGQTADAIALCRRAGQELSLLEDEEGSGETARDQMREVWRSLEEEVRKGTVGLGATTVLRNYIKAHWRTPASEPPSFQV